MDKIHLVIFSRNRAAQLDLLIRSLAINCPQLFNIYVIYRADSDDFITGYNLLCSESAYYFPNSINWLPQNSLKEDFIQSCNENYTLTCLGTDDCVFYRKCQIQPSQIENLFNNDKRLLTFSFRLGENTIVQNYVTGQRQPPLSRYNPQKYSTSFGENILIWNYNLCNSQLNYGYPYSYDFHCYKTSVLVDIIRRFETLPDLRSWEGCLCNPDNRTRMGINPLINRMASFEHSYVVNVPINSVQDVKIPLGAKHQLSPEELNQRFLDGERLSILCMDSIDIVGAHQDIPLIFESKSN
jgi:hypothetical protein